MIEEGIGSFVRKDDITKSFEKRLGDHLNAVDKKSIYSSTFDPKHITECPRRMIYRSTSVKPDKFKTKRCGLGERKWHFIGNSGLKILKDDLLLSDCNYNIVGKLDFVIQLGELSVAVQFYSVDNDTFQNILKQGAIRKDVVEIMVYMWLVELNNGLMVYENRNDNQITSFHITPHKPIIKSVVKKCKSLLEYEFKGIIPDRPYKTRTSNECRQCEYEIGCWSKQGDMNA